MYTFLQGQEQQSVKKIQGWTLYVNLSDKKEETKPQGFVLKYP